MTNHQRAIVRHIKDDLGLVASCRDDEFRITYPNLPVIESEQMAYYTDSNLDAVQTATLMAKL